MIPENRVDQLVARRLGLGRSWDRRSLDQAQMVALRRTVHHALAGSSLYRQRLAGLDPEMLRTAGDLGRIPLLDNRDIVADGHRLQCISQSRVARVVTLQTSGSTGQAKRLMFTSEDLEATMDFFLNGMRSLIDATDRVVVMLPYQQPDCVGDLLIKALSAGGIRAVGVWPPQPPMKDFIRTNRLTCAVGLPPQLLTLAEEIGPGLLRAMLLCSDYASPALRARIEHACRCRTFLHYGTTESGLGGAVECARHDGCHIRESDLLVEIIDPETGKNLADGELGEVVITTLGREAMPLLRYRTGDLARLTHAACSCGGITARLLDIRGRLAGCPLGDGLLHSQDLDDHLFQIPGLLDYRATLDREGKGRLHIAYLAVPSAGRIGEQIAGKLMEVPAVEKAALGGSLKVGEIIQVKQFTASHTVKQTILDLRTPGETDATPF
jgi:phenylacetate-CoA ligase